MGYTVTILLKKTTKDPVKLHLGHRHHSTIVTSPVVEIAEKPPPPRAAVTLVTEDGHQLRNLLLSL